jgi:hypothetical protein
MAVLKDYQFELNGYAWGLDLPIFVDEQGFDTGDASPITQDSVDPFSGVTRMGRDVVGAPEWTWNLYVDQEDAPSALAELGKLRYAWSNNGKGYPDSREVSMLRYAVGGRTRVVFGRPRRFTAKPGNLLHAGLVPPVVTFQASDRLHYDDVEQSIRMAMKPAEKGGATFPASFPLTFEREPDYVPASAMLVGGDARTWPVVTFYGPVTNPSVTIGDVVIALTGSIGEPVGSFPSSVTIDTRPWSQTVTRSGNTSGVILSRFTRMNRSAVAPGTYSAVFRGLDTSGESECQVRWRNAWQTL